MQRDVDRGASGKSHRNGPNDDAARTSETWDDTAPGKGGGKRTSAQSPRQLR